MDDSNKSGMLPCDVLIFLCGGVQITHLGVAAAHNLQTQPIKTIAIDYRANSVETGEQ